MMTDLLVRHAKRISSADAEKHVMAPVALPETFEVQTQITHSSDNGFDMKENGRFGTNRRTAVPQVESDARKDKCMCLKRSAGRLAIFLLKIF
jgi:hypothetical protein